MNGRRRRGLVVALMGPDGAGKTTLAKALAEEPQLRARRIYMGSNLEAGDTLPSTQALRAREREAGGWSAPARWAVRGLASANRYVEQQLRNAAARRHLASGGIVVYDRFFLDSATRPRRLNLRQRIRRGLKEAGAPEPDLVVVLDAPGAVLHERKGEHTPARLEQMRSSYRGLTERDSRVVVLDGNRAPGAVKADLLNLIRERLPHPGSPASVL